MEEEDKKKTIFNFYCHICLNQKTFEQFHQKKKKKKNVDKKRTTQLAGDSLSLEQLVINHKPNQWISFNYTSSEYSSSYFSITLYFQAQQYN